MKRPRVSLGGPYTGELLLAARWAAVMHALETVAPEVMEDLRARALAADPTSPAETAAAWARVWHLDHERIREEAADLVAVWRDGVALDGPPCWLIIDLGSYWPGLPATFSGTWAPSGESRAQARRRLIAELDGFLGRTAAEAGARPRTLYPDVPERFILWQCLGWDAARIAARYGIHGTRTFAPDPATGTRKPGPWRFGAIHDELKRTADALGLALRRGRPGKRPSVR